MTEVDWIRIKLDYCVGFCDNGSIVYPDGKDLAAMYGISEKRIYEHMAAEARRGNSWRKERARQGAKLYELLAEHGIQMLVNEATMPLSDATGLNFKSLSEDEVKLYRYCDSTLLWLREKMEAKP